MSALLSGLLGIASGVLAIFAVWALHELRRSSQRARETERFLISEINRRFGTGKEPPNAE